MIAKKIIRLTSLLCSLFLVAVAVAVALSPIKGICMAQFARISDGRLKKGIAHDGFTTGAFKNPQYNLETRFAPEFITIKCTLEFEVAEKFEGFQTLLLHEGFKFDSVKCKEENLTIKPWYKVGEARFWRVYLPRLQTGEKVQLFFIYSGKAPVDKDYYLYGADKFWYPRSPGITESPITLRCIIDEEWEPFFSGFSTPVIELKTDVKLHEYLVTHPFSLVVINKKIRTRPLPQAEEAEEAEELHLWANKPLENGVHLLLENAIKQLHTYYSSSIGKLPERKRYYLVTNKAGVKTEANLYNGVISFNLAQDIVERESGKEMSPAFLVNLSYGLSQSWWGGAVRPKCARENSLLKGLSAYSAYMALDELFSPELAADVVNEWKMHYLSSKQNFFWYEQPLTALSAVFNWQAELAQCKAPLIIHALRYLTGDEAFAQIVKETYANHGGSPVTIEEFQDLAQRISGLDLQWFFDYFFYDSFRLDLKVGSSKSILIGEEYETAIEVLEETHHFKGCVDLRIKTATETIEERIDFSKDGGRLSLRTQDPVEAVYVDAEGWWPDTNPENNSWVKTAVY